MIDFELRKTGIGGSDVAAIFGCSPNNDRNPLSVYLDKKGLSTPFGGNADTNFGNLLEPFILDQYETMHNVTLTRSLPMIRHPNRPYFIANVDAVSDTDIIVDAKNVGLYGNKGEYNGRAWGEPGTNQMPLPYLLQISHYCMVLDKEEGHMVPFFGGSDIRCYIYRRNLEFENKIAKKLTRFWEDHVLADNPPATAGTFDQVKLIWNQINEDETITASESISEICKKLLFLREKQKELKNEYEDAKKELAIFMQDKSVLVDAQNNILATFKEQIRPFFNSKVFKTFEKELYHEYTKLIKSRVLLIKDK